MSPCLAATRYSTNTISQKAVLLPGVVGHQDSQEAVPLPRVVGHQDSQEAVLLFRVAQHQT